MGSHLSDAITTVRISPTMADHILDLKVFGAVFNADLFFEWFELKTMAQEINISDGWVVLDKMINAPLHMQDAKEVAKQLLQPKCAEDIIRHFSIPKGILKLRRDHLPIMCKLFFKNDSAFHTEAMYKKIQDLSAKAKNDRVIWQNFLDLVFFYFDRDEKQVLIDAFNQPFAKEIL